MVELLTGTQTALLSLLSYPNSATVYLKGYGELDCLSLGGTKQEACRARSDTSYSGLIDTSLTSPSSQRRPLSIPVSVTVSFLRIPSVSVTPVLEPPSSPLDSPVSPPFSRAIRRHYPSRLEPRRENAPLSDSRAQDAAQIRGSAAYFRSSRCDDITNTAAPEGLFRHAPRGLQGFGLLLIWWRCGEGKLRVRKSASGFSP